MAFTGDAAETARRSGVPEPRSNERYVKDLNVLSTPDFEKRYIGDLVLGIANLTNGEVTVTFKAARELSRTELEPCFNLIASTSRQDYESSSWGWHPRRKKREMKEDEMRYLLLHPPNTTGSSPSDAVQGFLSFMLTHDSSPSVPVLYVYEIHLASELRQLGIGSCLMRMAEEVACRVQVNKVMLTCFVCNEKAFTFYERRGYRKDVVSPEDRTTRNKTIKADYAILSKDVSNS